MTHEQTLAESIKQVMELDAERNNPRKPWKLGDYKIGMYPHSITNPNGDAELGNWMLASVRWQPDADFIASAPLMASIIRQLTDIVCVQHEALLYVECNYEGGNKAAIVTKDLALSAPIMKGAADAFLAEVGE